MSKNVENNSNILKPTVKSNHMPVARAQTGGYRTDLQQGTPLKTLTSTLNTNSVISSTASNGGTTNTTGGPTNVLSTASSASSKLSLNAGSYIPKDKKEKINIENKEPSQTTGTTKVDVKQQIQNITPISQNAQFMTASYAMNRKLFLIFSKLFEQLQ